MRIELRVHVFTAQRLSSAPGELRPPRPGAGRGPGGDRFEARPRAALVWSAFLGCAPVAAPRGPAPLLIDDRATLVEQRRVQAAGNREADVRRHFGVQQGVLAQTLAAVDRLLGEPSYASRLRPADRAALCAVRARWRSEVHPSQVAVQAGGNTWAGLSRQYALEQGLLQQAFDVLGDLRGADGARLAQVLS